MPMKSRAINRMTLAELTAFHNREAAKRGKPQIAKWTGSRIALADRVAVLLAPRVRVRDVVLEALAVVSHFEHRVTGAQISGAEAAALPIARRAEFRSVGLSYEDVLAIVRERVPTARTTRQSLRQTVAFIRAGLPGYSAVLPGRRPRRCPAQPQATFH